MQNLVFRTSKFSYYLLFLFVLPVFIEAPAILDIWLKDVPGYAVLFCRLMLIIGLIDCIGIPLTTAISATGKLKWYEITVGGSQLLAVVFAYILFKWGTFPPETAFFLSIASSVIALILRMIFVKNLLQMSISEYLKTVMLPILLVTITASIAPSLILIYTSSSLFWTCISICLSLLCTMFAILTIGLTKSERVLVFKLIKQKLGKV